MKATILTHNVRTMNSSEPLHAPSSGGIPHSNVIRKQELAKRLAVSTRTIDNWMAKRLIPYIQISPRFYLYEYDAVLAALKKHYQVDSRP